MYVNVLDYIYQQTSTNAIRRTAPCRMNRSRGAGSIAVPDYCTGCPFGYYAKRFVVYMSFSYVLSLWFFLLVCHCGDMGLDLKPTFCLAIMPGHNSGTNPSYSPFHGTHQKIS